METTIGLTSAVKAPQGISRGADGKDYMFAIAHAALVKNTPYLVKANEYGAVTSATTATHGGYIGVPDKAYALSLIHI